jgi:hypothetical protein
MTTNWPMATSRIEGQPVVPGLRGRRDEGHGMTQPSDEQFREARRKGVRRTIWIAGTIAVVIFLLSILQMIKI